MNLFSTILSVLATVVICVMLINGLMIGYYTLIRRNKIKGAIGLAAATKNWKNSTSEAKRLNFFYLINSYAMHALAGLFLFSVVVTL